MSKAITATTGWWTLVTEGIDLRDLSDETREHIADMIRNGNVEGQIIQEEDETDDEDEHYGRSGNCDRCGALVHWDATIGTYIDDQNDQYCEDGERHWID